MQRTFDFEAGDRHATSTEKRRLSDQCARILYRLRQGRATNVELAAISLKYTSRISDLRKAGYDVQCVEKDTRTGVCLYELQGGD